MTVAELIEKLKTLPPQTRVMTQGYEGGVDDAIFGRVVDVKLNVNDAWYYGAHEVVDDDDGNNEGEIVKAIIL